MSDKSAISIIIPLHNEENNIDVLYDAIINTMQSLHHDYEIVFVDDGSRDKSFDLVKKISSRDQKVRGISLSRNFGHQIALLAG